jgi:hypothetical protein
MKQHAEMRRSDLKLITGDGAAVLQLRPVRPAASETARQRRRHNDQLTPEPGWAYQLGLKRPGGSDGGGDAA